MFDVYFDGKPDVKIILHFPIFGLVISGGKNGSNKNYLLTSLIQLDALSHAKLNKESKAIIFQLILRLLLNIRK